MSGSILDERREQIRAERRVSPELEADLSGEARAPNDDLMTIYLDPSATREVEVLVPVAKHGFHHIK